MAKIFFNIRPFLTMNKGPIANKIIQGKFKMRPNPK